MGLRLLLFRLLMVFFFAGICARPPSYIRMTGGVITEDGANGD
jgi:hypothetical protein